MTGFSIDADVLVAGAGGAGLVASLVAARSGLSVMTLDSSERFEQGSNTAMSTAMIPAAGSRWQAAAGIQDDPAIFLADVMRKTNGSADPIVAEALVEVAPDLVAWLADEVGVPLDLVTDFRYPGHSQHRMHTVPDRSGRTLHAALAAAARKEANLTIAVPFRLRTVGFSERGGFLAEIMDPDGRRETLQVGSVVLATGGYGANAAMVAECLPDMRSALYFGSDACSGDALEIGRALGADIGYLDAYQGHGSIAVPHNILVTWAAVTHGGIILGAHGRRFGDESRGYSEYAAEVLSQPGGDAWVVFDHEIDRLCRPFADYGALVDGGAVRSAADSEALAALVGAPAESVDSALREAGAAARGDAADPWGRLDWERILDPPYRAVHVTGALIHTQGGLRTNGHGSVMRDRAPVPGLYACGGAAAGISGHGAGGYLAGNGLLAALGLGLVAGRSVVRRSEDLG